MDVIQTHPLSVARLQSKQTTKRRRSKKKRNELAVISSSSSSSSFSCSCSGIGLHDKCTKVITVKMTNRRRGKFNIQTAHQNSKIICCVSERQSFIRINTINYCEKVPHKRKCTKVFAEKLVGKLRYAHNQRQIKIGPEKYRVSFT